MLHHALQLSTVVAHPFEELQIVSDIRTRIAQLAADEDVWRLGLPDGLTSDEKAGAAEEEYGWFGLAAEP